MGMKYFLILTLLVGLWGCFPQIDTACPSGETFDPLTRSCSSAVDISNLPNQNPVIITPVNDFNVNEDANYPLTSNIFQVDEGGGSEENVNALTFRFSSDNTSLLDSTDITLVNFNESLNEDAQTKTPQLLLNPVSQTVGSANITMTILDGVGGVTTDIFTLSVFSSNDAPTINGAASLPNTSSEEDAVITVTFIGDEGGGVDEDSQILSIQGITSDSTLIYASSVQIIHKGLGFGNFNFTPVSLLELGDASESNVTLLITPTANSSGTANISVTLSDGSATQAATFQATVSNVNDAMNYVPGSEISSFGTINEDSGPVDVTFKIDEGGGATEDSQVVSVASVTSSNTTLIPIANIKFSNIGDGGGVQQAFVSSYPVPLEAAATQLTTDASDDSVVMRIVPASNVSGASLITITFNDNGSPTPASLVDTAVSIVSVIVLPVNDAPVFTNASNPSTVSEGTSSILISFNIDEGGSDDEDSQTITLTGSSSDTNIISNSNILLSSFSDTSSDSNATAATVTLSLNSSDVNTRGTDMTVTITANDGSTSTAQEFVVDIDPVDDSEQFISATPDILTTPSITYNLGESTRFITLRVGEGGNGGTPATNYETDPDVVSISIATSNTSLLPESSITISYNGVELGTAGASPLALEGPGQAARDADVVVQMNFAPGLVASTNLTFTIDDSQASFPAAAVSFPVIIENVVAIHNGWENVRAVGKRFIKGGGTEDPSVTIRWKEMDLFSGGSALVKNTGKWTWNVYRQESISSFPNTAPTMDHNSVYGTVGAGTAQADYSFTDTAVQPGTIYYYEVRPVLRSGEGLNTIEVPTAETTFNRIRVVVPPDNMALVHRWIANQEVCASLGQVTDPANNFRCSYTGPGAVGGFFDLTDDVMIEVNEAGCNFTSGPDCTNFGCIDILTASNPNTDYGAFDLAGNVFYDRRGGGCFVGDGANWTRITSSVEMASYAASTGNGDASLSGLPPITGMDQAGANTYCTARTIQCDGSTCGNSDYTSLFANSGVKQLVSRKQFVLAAAWDLVDPNTDTDTEIDTIEDGINLHIINNCNTNKASGMTYFDTPFPPGSIFLDTIPFDLTSGEKKLGTGSTSTQRCTSRYGVQDLVGNVREWNADRCTSNAAADTCVAAAAVNTTEAPEINNFGYDFSGAAPDGFGGAADCAPLQNCNVAVSFPSTLNFTHIYPDVGLPAEDGSSGAVLISNASFPAASFHNDIVDLNIDSEGNNTVRAFVSGGHSDFSDAASTTTPDNGQGDGAAAGRYTLELLDISRGNPDTGFRCGVRVTY